MKSPNMCGVILYEGGADPSRLLAMGAVPSTNTLVLRQAVLAPCLRSGDLVILWDGEIYNGSSLRRFLGLPRDATDPVVVLRGWEREGQSFLGEIDGPFAAAILDLAKGTWTLARGWQGLCPLYWLESKVGITFSRDLPRLLRCQWVTVEPHWEKIPEYLVFNHVAGGHTLYRGVRELLPGQILSGRFGKRETVLTKMPPPIKLPVKSTAQERLEERLGKLLRSATLRLLTHAPGGPPLLFLSGGIDSSLLALALSEHERARGTMTVTVTCPGYRHDEAPFARTVREALGLRGVEIPLTPDLFSSAWVESVRALQVPLTSTNQVPWWLLCQWAKENGEQVAFSGEGADGWWSGGLYEDERHALNALWEEDPAEAGLRVIFCRTHCLNHPDLIRRITCAPLDISSRWSLWQEALTDPLVSSLDDAAVLYHVATAGNRLLTRADLVATSHEVHLYLPFLERRWLRGISSIPFLGRNFAGVRKWPLKLICAARWGDTFAYRKKIGFPFPIRTWIRQANSPLFERFRTILLEPRTLHRPIYRKEVLQHEIVRRLNGTVKPADWLLWGILNVELWLRDLEG